ncbi:hypothetical protein S83_066903, partial [Arachis hypogaea]
RKIEHLPAYSLPEKESYNKAVGITEDNEEWDDSTVSSYVSKMRMQNRMEASTRRERALAYDFSQQ